jgi:hypothetical protein
VLLNSSGALAYRASLAPPATSATAPCGDLGASATAYLVSIDGRKAVVPLYEGPIELSAYATPTSSGALLVALATNNGTGWWLGNITAAGCSPSGVAASIPPGGQALANFTCPAAPTLTSTAYNLAGAAVAVATAVAQSQQAAGIAPPPSPLPCQNAAIDISSSNIAQFIVKTQPLQQYQPILSRYPGYLFGAPYPLYLGYSGGAGSFSAVAYYDLSSYNINVNKHKYISIAWFTPFIEDNNTIIFIFVTDKNVNNIVIVYWYNGASGSTSSLNNLGTSLKSLLGSQKTAIHYIYAGPIYPLYWTVYYADVNAYLNGAYGYIGFGYYFAGRAPPLANGYFDYICVG